MSLLLGVTLSGGLLWQLETAWQYGKIHACRPKGLGALGMCPLDAPSEADGAGQGGWPGLEPDHVREAAPEMQSLQPSRWLCHVSRPHCSALISVAWEVTCLMLPGYQQVEKDPNRHLAGHVYRDLNA